MDYKNAITAFLKNKNIEVLNFGTDTPESVDYPDFGHAVAQALEEGKADLGIVICGSGNGIAMTANKHPHVRCTICFQQATQAQDADPLGNALDAGQACEPPVQRGLEQGFWHGRLGHPKIVKSD